MRCCSAPAAPGAARERHAVTEPEALATFTSGVPRAVNVAEIERELQHVWRAAGEAETEGAVLRASMLNFIVRVSDHDRDTMAVEAVARVSTELPCRAFVLIDTPGTPQDPPLEAWISSHCQPAGPGGKLVCCEQITVRVTPQAVDGLPSTLLALLVPDLPTALWWPGDAALDGPLFARLARHVDTLVVDSSQFAVPARGLGALSRWARSSPELAVADLAWTRLDAWRELTAGQFDAAPFAALLPTLHAVEIEHDAAAGGLAWLYCGWLASRLGWTMLGRDAAAVHLRGAHGEVLITLRAASAHAGAGNDPALAPGLRSVVLHAAESTTFHVAASRTHHTLLEARVERPDACPLPRLLEPKPLDAGAELVHVLARTRRNVAFEDALHVAARFAGAA